MKRSAQRWKSSGRGLARGLSSTSEAKQGRRNPTPALLIDQSTIDNAVYGAQLHRMVRYRIKKMGGSIMPASSFTKDFELKSAEAKRRFEAYEAEKGVTIKAPDHDPLKKGREILARRFSSSKN